MVVHAVNKWQFYSQNILMNVVSLFQIPPHCGSVKDPWRHCTTAKTGTFLQVSGHYKAVLTRVQLQNYLQIRVSRFLCSKLSPLPYSCRNSTLKICLDCCEMINAVSLFAGEKYLSVQDFFFFLDEEVREYRLSILTFAPHQRPSQNCHQKVDVTVTWDLGL